MHERDECVCRRDHHAVSYQAVTRDDDNWNRVWTLFHDALDLPAADRDGFLRREAGDDDMLRAEIESLLKAHDDGVADDLLAEPIDAVQQLDPGSLIGRSIGAYRITDVLGEGGMGVVYAAEQTAPMKRTVALKLIKLGMDSREVIARFESERQALALMSHPNIARAYDAGATADGRPYFVMEYVPGIPITAYCDKRKLTIEQRIRLFLKVCAGVQHAHHKGIIHRDLKPSNILVVEEGDQAEPKVIDFGVSKALTERLTPDALHTRLGRFIGTPNYVSPEQAEMGGLGIDTRSDIYTLGVLLYEMTVGSRPFDDLDLKAQDQAGLTTILRDRDPPRPSRRLQTRTDELKDIATRRSTTRERLIRDIRGDLDWIILRALESDRTRRYQTVDEFARDLHRFFSNRPVTARPPSVRYRAQKFVSRNRLLVGSAAIVAMAAVIGVVGLATGLIQAREAQAVAEAERNNARVISSFLESILVAASPYVSDGADTTLLVELLNDADARVDRELAGQPMLAAELQKTIATTFRALGKPERAEAAARKGLRLLDAPALVDTTAVGLSLSNQLALALWAQGDLEASLEQSRHVLELQRSLLGPTDPQTLSTMNNVGLALKALERYAEAEPVYRELVELKTRELGGSHRSTLITKNNLANLYRDRQEYAAAEAVMRPAVDEAIAALGGDDPDTLAMRDSYGSILAKLGRYEEAERIHSEVIDRMREINGPEHPDTLGAVYHLGQFYMETGQFRDAEASFRQALEGIERSLGPDHRFAIFSLNWLGQSQLALGQWPDAERSFRRLLDAAARGDMSDSALVPLARCRLGAALVQKGESGQAIELLTRCRPELVDRFGAEHADTRAASDALDEALQMAAGSPD